jgi:hypothetical protein
VPDGRTNGSASSRLREYGKETEQLEQGYPAGQPTAGAVAGERGDAVTTEVW